MSTTRNQARENVRRLAKQSKTAPAAEPPLEPTPAEQAEPLRISLDFAPALYNEFQDWITGAGRKIGARIRRADVLRVLVRRLLTDEAFADEILEVLRQNYRRR